LSGTRAQDRDLIVVARLKGLYSLNLAFTRVTDEGLESLTRTGCEELNLMGTRVTDGAVATLRKCRKLFRLNLADTAITNEGVRALVRAFPDLRLCRVASGKKGQFHIMESFRAGKPQYKELMIGDTLFARALVRPAGEGPGEPDRSRLATT